ncbi:unnamed protein product [Parnassius mnemosyne]|uniref:Uncharacterized protein n=1 Tax=Parnassius mnemosyne TaxID=213953 RepID=A0AAV1L6G1_9NEOP
MRRLQFSLRSSETTCGKQMLAYHSALTVLCPSRGIVVTWPVLETNVATIFFATLRERTIFVGFNSFSNTQIRDWFFVSGSYACILDSSPDRMLYTAFEDPAWNLSRVLTHQVTRAAFCSSQSECGIHRENNFFTPNCSCNIICI